MKNLLLSSFIFSAALSQAQNLKLSDWKDATVKVTSFPCATKKPQLEGTGLLVQNNNQIYVLTSEHVVLHSDSPSVCHRIQTLKGSNLEASLAKVSFWDGMATLELKTSPSVTPFALDMEKFRNPEEISPKLTALGYPLASFAIQTLEHGRAITFKSSRSLIPGIPDMVEASHLPVEYGMSGGVLLSEDSKGNYQFAGLLSHQVLKRNPSQGTQVSIAPARDGDLVLAIPADFVKKWITKKTDSLVWKRDLKGQIAGKEVLSYGPLLFEIKKQKAQEFLSNELRGGADGSGIGGFTEAEGNTSENWNAVQVSLNMEESPSAKMQNLEIQLLNQWRDRLLRGQKIQVPFLRESGVSHLKAFTTLPQFLTLWLRQAGQPVTFGSDESSQLAIISEQGTRFIQSLKEAANKPEDKIWFSMIRDQIMLAPLGLISAAELENLLKGVHEKTWAQFYDDDFENAVQLESLLQKLISAMKKNGL